jgi:hypothetical protein
MKKIKLYILIFKNTSFLKIGITSSIYKRINSITMEISQEVDLCQSIIVTSKNNSDIRLLEKNLLRITESYFDSPFSDCNSKREYRKKECLKVLLSFINSQKVFGLKFELYEGIDFSNNYGNLIPKTYFPPDIVTNGISTVLMEDVRKYCIKENTLVQDFINNTIYLKIKSLNIARNDDKIVKLKNLIW